MLAVENIRKVVAFHVVISIVAALLFILFPKASSIRGVSGGIGIMAAFLGNGIALWFSLRTKDNRLYVLAAASFIPLAYWLLVIL